MHKFLAENIIVIDSLDAQILVLSYQVLLFVFKIFKLLQMLSHPVLRTKPDIHYM
jgi:hypothetical protein